MKSMTRILALNRPGLSCGAGLAMLVVLATGCTSRLARENILANTETAYGLTVAQNAQTQVPELKLGYARHELFYVPSSKTLAYTNAGKSIGGEVPTATVNSNDPSKTPEVVAEIVIGSGAKANATESSANFRVRQRLAVGKIAVVSPGAEALFVAEDGGGYRAFKSLSDSADQAFRAELNTLVSKPLTTPVALDGTTFTTNQTFLYATARANDLSPGDTLDNVAAKGGTPLRLLVEDLRDKTQP